MGKVELKVVNGNVVATSREVAERFEKEHKTVLRSIENLIGDIEFGEIEGVAQNCANLFIKSEYVHEQNKQAYKEYLMTKDGFTLLAMGFSGKQALQFKLEYINQFNLMEQQLKEIENIVVENGEFNIEEYNNINFKTAQRVNKAFRTTDDINKTYKRFVEYSKSKLDVPTRITRLNQIIKALDQREDNLYIEKKKGYKAEREEIIELREEILRDINEINNRSYGQRLGHVQKLVSVM